MSSSAASPNDPVVVDLTESSGDDGDKEDATPSLFVQKDLVKHEEDSKNTTSLLPASHLFVQKDLVKHLKPHQSKGVQFIWKNCFAKDAEGGCILAHYMGLGRLPSAEVDRWEMMSHIYMTRNIFWD
jgi:SNF2 family DNA or RNA helicase